MPKGKWAQGIVPRNFAWIIKDQLAVCERPGGYGEHHRRVRRTEEIIWLREQGFTSVISLIPSTHNLHNYEEEEVPYLHRPYVSDDDAPAFVGELFPEIAALLNEGGKVLLHQEELGDRVSGLVAGYLLWAELLPDGPQAISIVERMVDRQMGPVGRQIVSSAQDLRTARSAKGRKRGKRGKSSKSSKSGT